MVELFGRKLSAIRARRAHRCAWQQVAGVELLEHADGPERGVRVLDFRTGAGLSFRVAVDRGFDLLAADYRGVPIGWRSPTGPRHPGLASPEENRGWGFLRSFTGLLATCGLDQALAPTTSPARRSTSIRASARATIRCTAGSRRSRRVFWAMASAGRATRARCGPRARSLRWRCSARTWCCTRRIEAALGGTTISVEDRVENRGFRPTPHMLLYHYNFGWPLLDEGAELLVPSRAIVHAMHGDLHAQGVGYRIQGPPEADFSEQVYEHDVVAGAGRHGFGRC